MSQQIKCESTRIEQTLCETNALLMRENTRVSNEYTVMYTQLHESQTELRQCVKDKDQEINRLMKRNKKLKQQLVEKTRKLEEENEKLVNDNQTKSRRIETLTKHEILLKIRKFKCFNRLIRSREIIVNNASWYIKAYITKEEETEYLSYYLVCNGNGDSEWSFEVSAELRILFLDEGWDGGYFCKKFNWRVFDNNTPDMGYRKFLKRKVILNKSNGYIDNEDIILKAVFYIDD